MESEQGQSPEQLAAALAAIRVDLDFPAKEYAVGIEGPNSDAFNAQSMNAVRPQHALDAVRNPDDVAVYAYQDARMFLATKVPTGDFVLLVIGSEAGKQRTIQVAYRLYGEESEVRSLATDASAAFQTLLERFAIPFKSKGRDVVFVPVLTGQIPPTGQLDLTGLSGLVGIDLVGRRSLTLNMSLKISDQGQVTLAWPFIVDTAEYERQLKRHRR
jgi:hypothetical protein